MLLFYFQVEVYILFVDIYLWAAVSVAGEQTLMVEVEQLNKRKKLSVGTAWLIVCFNRHVFVFSLRGCGIHGTAGTVTLIRYGAVLIPVNIISSLTTTASKLSSEWTQRHYELNMCYSPSLHWSKELTCYRAKYHHFAWRISTHTGF